MYMYIRSCICAACDAMEKEPATALWHCVWSDGNNTTQHSVWMQQQNNNKNNNNYYYQQYDKCKIKFHRLKLSAVLKITNMHQPFGISKTVYTCTWMHGILLSAKHSVYKLYKIHNSKNLSFSVVCTCIHICAHCIWV